MKASRTKPNDLKATVLSDIHSQNHLQEIIEFYNEATSDYRFWSPKMNMHYGYLGSWKQFFKREEMLEQMNLEVFKRVNINPGDVIIDAGCGTGATSRSMVKNYPTSKAIGLNIVPSHIQTGKVFNRSAENGRNICLLQADYHNAPLPNAMADGIFAMESACHSQNKFTLLCEFGRLLKPGGKLVITDCFLRNPNKRMNPVSRWAYKLFRKCWSVPHLAEINLFETMLHDAGFGNVTVEDVRRKVAPSVMHSPWVVAKFLWNQLLSGQRSGAQTIKNLKAVLLSIIIGLDAKKFSYYIVTAERNP